MPSYSCNSQLVNENNLTWETNWKKIHILVKNILMTILFHLNRTDSGPVAVVTPRATNYTSTRNEPPTVLALQIECKFSF